MANTYNYKLSDFFDFVSLSAVEGVDYFIDESTLYVNNSSSWYGTIDSMVSDTKTLCSIDLSRFSNLSSLQTFDPYISSIQLPSYTKLSYISAGNLKNTSLFLSGSNFEILGIYTCPLLSSIDLSGVYSIQNIMLIGNEMLTDVYFNSNNFNFNESLTYSVNIASNLLTNESLDSLWTSVSSALTGESVTYSFVNLTVTNSVTGLSSDVIDFLTTKGVNVSLTIPE